MANENLRSALSDAGLTAEQFADIVGVDPKTVRRWVAGRAPYRRHRAAIARALDRTEHDLWPDEAPGLANGIGKMDGRAEPGDVFGSWAGETDPGVPDPIALVAGTDASVDVIDDGGGALISAELVAALIDCASAGHLIRVLTTAPIRALEPLLGHAQLELRVWDAPLAPRLLRAGDVMRLGLALPGNADAPWPVLELRPRTAGGLFERMVRYFDETWSAADEILQDVEHLAKYLGQDEPDAASLPPRVDQADASAPDAPGLAPAPVEPRSSARRWPGRDR